MSAGCQLCISLECRLSTLNQFGVQVVNFESVWSAGYQLCISMECGLSTLNQFGVHIVSFESVGSACCQLCSLGYRLSILNQFGV